jgi:hypothetical protein
MRVFLSWSGDRSRTAAHIYRELFSLVLQTIDVQITGDQIQPGGDWAIEVRHMLTTADCTILFLTSENLENPWMLFESGAWWASEVFLIPVLVDISPVDLAGPFTQMQAIGVTRDETFRLINQLNLRSNRPVSEGTIRQAFEKAWPELGDRLAVIAERQVLPTSPEISPFWRAQDAAEALKLLRKLESDIRKLSTKAGA